MHRCIDEDPAIPSRAFARVMRAYAHWSIREDDAAGPLEDLRANASLASVLPSTQWRPRSESVG